VISDNALRNSSSQAARLTPIALILAIAAGAAGSCDPAGPTAPNAPAEITELPRQLTGAEAQLLNATNAFGFDLLREIVTSAPDSSHFISPLSASMALGMTMNGAAGTTFDEMRNTLRFGTLSQTDINTSYRGLIDLLGELDPHVSFGIANSIWHLPELTPLPQFVADVTGSFDATIQAIDFADPGAAATINAWVEERTRGRIDEIVPDPIPGDVVAYLINAIHFKGEWTYRFDPAQTQAGPFHLADGRTVSVPFMQRQGGFLLAGTSQYRLVEVPYGGQAFAMTILLPNEGVRLDHLVTAMTQSEWAAATAGLAPAPANTPLFLPRFTMEWERSLKETLASLGMPTAFTAQADFTSMFGESGIFITEVLQKTFVQVNEEGTEAAAATSVEMGRTSAPEPVRIDRPFLFVLRERLSGTILFIGTCLEPQGG